MVPEARGELGRGYLCRYKRVREYSMKKCRMECWHNKRLQVVKGRLKSWSIVIVHHSSALFTTSWEIMTRRAIFCNRYFSSSTFHCPPCAPVSPSNPGCSRWHAIAAWMIFASETADVPLTFPS